MKIRFGQFVKAGMMALDPSKRLRIRESKTLDQILGLFFVLFEVGASGQISVRHTKLLSRFAWSPHASGWKEDSSNCRTEGGHGPFRGLDAPFALGMKVKNFRAEVNRARRTGQQRSGSEVSWRQKKNGDWILSEPTIRFAVYPTSVLLPKGHRIRVALAGAAAGIFSDTRRSLD
jgi:hypothetical protein